MGAITPFAGLPASWGSTTVKAQIDIDNEEGPMSAKPSREQIEARAYEIYVEQGREDGHDVEHWLLAEQELSGKPEPAAARVSTAPQAPQRSVAVGAASVATPSTTVNPRGKS